MKNLETRLSELENLDRAIQPIVQWEGAAPPRQVKGRPLHILRWLRPGETIRGARSDPATPPKGEI